MNEQRTYMTYEVNTDKAWELVGGTSFAGMLWGEYTVEKIEAVLGSGELKKSKMDDGKTTRNWFILFEDGIVITLYDWKRIEPLKSYIDWTFGAHPSSYIGVSVDELRARVRSILDSGTMYRLEA